MGKTNYRYPSPPRNDWNLHGCRVELEQEGKKYHPGETVEAKVVCTFPVLTEVTNIVAYLIGEESTKWLKIVNHGNIDRADIRTEESSGYNKFLSIEKRLTDKGTFDPGNYKFAFSFVLPEDIPSSFQSNRGKVEFFVKVNVECENSACTDKEEVQVISPVKNTEFAWFDSRIPTYALYNQSIEKFFPASCCMGDGSLVMDLYLPKRAFVQGERVQVQVEVSNMCDQKIDRIELILGQTIQSKGGATEDGSKYDHNVLFVLKKEGLKSYEEKSYVLVMEVPETPLVPNFTQCKLFSQKFWIDVIAVLGHNFDVKITTWVLIGQGEATETRPEDHSANRLLNRTNSRTRDQAGARNIKSLLPSKGPAPYSSYKQRPSGFAMPQPISTLPTEPPTMPLPPNSQVPTRNEAYPPQVGPRLAMPDIPHEDPPSYEDVVWNEVHDIVTGSSQSTSGDRGYKSPGNIIPSAPVASPDVDSFRSAEPIFKPTMVGVANFAPYPTVGTPMGMPGSAPYPPVSTPLGVPGSAPYPLEATPPACDSIGFIGLKDSSTMPTTSKNLPYPPQNIPVTSPAPYPSVPLPPPHIYPPERSSTSYTPMPMPSTAPYPTDPLSQWDLVRKAVPGMVASHRLPSSGFYSPEKPPPRVDAPTMPMPMPGISGNRYSSEDGTPNLVVPYANNPLSSSGLYPPEKPPPRVAPTISMPMPMPSLPGDGWSSGNGTQNVVPYPIDIPLQVCEAIGFAVLENSGTDNGVSQKPISKSNT